MAKELLTIQEAADALGVRTQSIRYHTQKGTMPIISPPGAPAQIAVADVARYAQKRGLPFNLDNAKAPAKAAPAKVRVDPARLPMQSFTNLPLTMSEAFDRLVEAVERLSKENETLRQQVTRLEADLDAATAPLVDPGPDLNGLVARLPAVFGKEV